MAMASSVSVTHINTVTTIFTPQPSCFASSNLWLQTTRCATYFPPFSSRPTNTYLQGLECPYTVLGPRQNGNKEDNSCYQYNAFTAPGTVYSACPQSMTPAGEDTTSLGNGVVLIQTACCPEAYNFSAPSGIPDTLPRLIKGTTYQMIINTDSLCKATAVPQLAGKNVTLTRSTSPQVATTTATWDGGALFATPHYLQKYIYEGDSTTSTCFGGGCPGQSNPLAPTPTPTMAPTDSYIPPPAHPVTQFTPSPSCLSRDNLFLVSSRCHLAVKDTMTRSPPWLHCTIAKAGEPDIDNTDCYQGMDEHRDRTTGTDGTTTFYSTCPIGYTVAHSTTRHPYDEGIYDEYGPHKIYDATLSSFLCCPTNYAFTYNQDDTLYSTTMHNKEVFSVQFHGIPQCKMTHVWPLANRALTMTLSADDELPGERRKLPRGQQQVLAPKPTPPPVTTTRWDVTDKTLWAEAQHFSYVVFHETYTCYENCDQYFTYSYHNTDQNVKPTGAPRIVRTKPPRPPRPTAKNMKTKSSSTSSAKPRPVVTPGAQGGGDVGNPNPGVKVAEAEAADMRREPAKGSHAKVHAPARGNIHV